MDTWPAHSYVNLPQSVTSNFISTQLSKMSLYVVDLRFPFTGTKRHETWSRWRCSCTKWTLWRHGLPKLVWKYLSGLQRALTSTEHLWNELECSMHTRPPHSTPVPEPTLQFPQPGSKILLLYTVHFCHFPFTLLTCLFHTLKSKNIGRGK